MVQETLPAGDCSTVLILSGRIHGNWHRACITTFDTEYERMSPDMTMEWRFRMVQRPDERYQQATGNGDDAFNNPEGDDIEIVDGGGVGRERNQPNTSETGFMGGGGGSEVAAIGDFDPRGQGDAGAHRGVGGTSLDDQEPERNPGGAAVPLPGSDVLIDPQTGMSGHISKTLGHPGQQLDPAEAARDEHNAAAFPSDPS